MSTISANMCDHWVKTVSVGRGNKPDLSPDEAERVALATRKLVDAYGTQAKLAEALGQSQQRVSKIANRRDPPGMPFARDVARLLGIGLDELLTGEPGGLPRLGGHPDWAEASERAVQASPHLETQIRDLATVGAPEIPARLTPEWLVMMAQLWSMAK